MRLTGSNPAVVMEKSPKEKFKMLILNYTPHKVSIRKADMTFLDLDPEPVPARRAVKNVVLGTVDGIVVSSQVFGSVENLPEPKEGVLLLVSLIVAQAHPERRDLVTPGTAIRNPDGTQSGCIGLSQVPE